MRVHSKSVVVACGIILFVSSTSSTMLLTSLLMSMKGGMILGKMGLGGILMMMIAGQQYNQNQNQKRSIGLVRTTRSIGGESEIIEKNISIPQPSPALLHMLSNRSEFQRQINVLDPLRCLPKLVCGLNLGGIASSPSTSSSLMNDLAYLVQVLRDDDDVDDDSNEEDKKERGDGTNKDGNNNSDEQHKYKGQSSEEEHSEHSDDDEYEQLKKLEKAKLEEMAEEELISEEPELLGFVLKDMKKKYPGLDIKPGTSGVPTKHNKKPQKERGDFIYGFRNPLHKSSEKHNEAQDDDDDFKSDPFFADLPFRRRSIKFTDTTPIEAIQELAFRRARKMKFVERKKKQYDQTEDLLAHVKIAGELKDRLRSPRQCRSFFGNCPYTRTEIEDVIVRLQNVLSSPAGSGDKVVNLKQTGGTEKKGAIISGSGNVINIQTGVSAGYTQISHELGNGNKVEILLRVNGKNNKTEAIIKKPNGTQIINLTPTTPKPKPTSLPLTPSVKNVTLNTKIDPQSVKPKPNLTPSENQTIAEVLQRLNATLDYLSGFENDTLTGEDTGAEKTSQESSPEVVLELEHEHDDEQGDDESLKNIDESFAETVQNAVAVGAPPKKSTKTKKQEQKSKDDSESDQDLYDEPEENENENDRENSEEYDDNNEGNKSGDIVYDDLRKEIDSASSDIREDYEDDPDRRIVARPEIFFVPYTARRPNFKVPPPNSNSKGQGQQQGYRKKGLKGHKSGKKPNKNKNRDQYIDDDEDVSQDYPEQHREPESSVSSAASFLTSLLPARFRLGQQQQSARPLTAIRPYIAYGRNPYPRLPLLGQGKDKKRRRRPQNKEAPQDDDTDTDDESEEDTPVLPVKKQKTKNSQKTKTESPKIPVKSNPKTKYPAEDIPLGGQGVDFPSEEESEYLFERPQNPQKFWTPPNGMVHPDMFPKIKYSDDKPAAAIKSRSKSKSSTTSTTTEKSTTTTVATTKAPRKTTKTTQVVGPSKDRYRIRPQNSTNSAKERRRRPSLRGSGRDERNLIGDFEQTPDGLLEIDDEGF